MSTHCMLPKTSSIAKVICARESDKSQNEPVKANGNLLSLMEFLAGHTQLSRSKSGLFSS